MEKSSDFLKYVIEHFEKVYITRNNFILTVLGLYQKDNDDIYQKFDFLEVYKGHCILDAHYSDFAEAYKWFSFYLLHIEDKLEDCNTFIADLNELEQKVEQVDVSAVLEMIFEKSTPLIQVIEEHIMDYTFDEFTQYVERQCQKIKLEEDERLKNVEKSRKGIKTMANKKKKDTTEDETISMLNDLINKMEEAQSKDNDFNTQREEILKEAEQKEQEQPRSPLYERFKALIKEKEKSEELTYDEDGNILKETLRKTELLNQYLRERVYGQDQAILSFVSGYFKSELSSLSQDKRERPRATFLFAGPAGVGKTYLAEEAAKGLGIECQRFDMSEYSDDKEANIMFCGVDASYKAAKSGQVTDYVSHHPNAILIFDEIEKAHMNVIHLFLQILDQGVLRDNYTEEEVPFKDNIIIFTTNVGHELYDDEELNLLTISRRTILKSIGDEINPVTHEKAFPQAIISRFALGNVIMFNRLGSDHLLSIIQNELDTQVKGIVSKTSLDINIDSLISYVLLFSEGSETDARTIKGKASAFIYEELYELLRLSKAKNSELKGVHYQVELSENNEEIKQLFASNEKDTILLIADEKNYKKINPKLKQYNVIYTQDEEEVKSLIKHQSITLVLLDLTLDSTSHLDALNIEDITSKGQKIFDYIVTYSTLPIYILDDHNKISPEEKVSLLRNGAKDIINIKDKNWLDVIVDKIHDEFIKNNIRYLGRMNKVLNYRSFQTLDEESHIATITLYDLKLVPAIEASDHKKILDNVSRPNVTFNDVIGLNDAKDELKYLVNFLRQPTHFIQKGLKAPKGILLYGPAGTGKTLLARALAGESDVTFISSAGHEFIKGVQGEGIKYVHELFRIARKYAPSILFIDEIDSIGLNRQAGNKTDDVLTTFLTEMDGFNTDPRRPVFVLAATNASLEQNSSRSLDPALLRRFERRILVELPKKEDRLLYLNKVLKDFSISSEMKENIATRSVGMSLSDLSLVVNLAQRNVYKYNATELTDKILEDAFETFNSGDVKKWSTEEVLKTARHEAGHALISCLTGNVPTYLTIVSRGNHGGYAQMEHKEQGSYTKPELLSHVKTALGGRAAEIVYYGREEGLSTGPSQDLNQASLIIKNMITIFGMDEDNLVALDNYEPQDLYQKINTYLKDILESDIKVLTAHKEELDKIVETLLKQDSLKQEEIKALLNL